MEKENIYYVYALLDPSDCDNIFYIGKGKNSRVTDHYAPTRVKVNSYKNNIIRKYRNLGFKDKYVILEKYLDEEHALFLEMHLISFLVEKT